MAPWPRASPSGNRAQGLDPRDWTATGDDEGGPDDSAQD